MLDAVADDAFDRMAATVRTVLGVPVALVSLVDRNGQVFPGQAGLPKPLDETRSTPLTHSFCQHVVRSSEALIISDARTDERLRDNLAVSDLGFIGYAGVPLVNFDGVVVGSLCAIDTGPHCWSEADVTLLTDLGAACSAELQLRTAASRATEAQHHTGALLMLSESLSHAVTPEQVSVAVEQLARDRLGACLAGIGMLTPDSETLRPVDCFGPPAVQDDNHRALFSPDTPACSVAGAGKPLLYRDLDELGTHYPQAAVALAAVGGVACAYLPLRVNFRIVGVLAAVWNKPHTFDPSEQALLKGLSRYAAQAVERAQLLAERRDVADTLQSAMLPGLPTPDTIQAAACYLPARSLNSVGGDWYDSFELPGGELIVSVGDVEGHDIEAAAIMGRVRAALASLAIGRPGPPSDVLTALDEVLHTQPVNRYATAILATIDENTNMLTWSNAGHPAPLLSRPGDPVRYLHESPDRPLGLRLTPTERTTHTVDFPPGSTLLLYTDGLLEARRGSHDQLLASTERHRAQPPAKLIDAVLSDWLDISHHDDDVVLLAIHVPSSPADDEP